MKISRSEAKRMGILPEEWNRQSRSKKKAEVTEVVDRVFDQLCKSHDLPTPEHEYHWNELAETPILNPETGKPYKWRFDYLFDGWLAVEKVGGVWIKGHHSRGQTQIDDMKRRNEAQIMGFVVLEFPPEQFEDGSAFATIRRALGAKEELP